MDMTRTEIAKKHGLPITAEWCYWHPLLAAMQEYAEQEARAYASWIANQVIAGHTSHKLWLDYKAEVLDQRPDNL